MTFGKNIQRKTKSW